MAKTEKYPRTLTSGSLVALATPGEGRVAGEEKSRAAKGRRRLGSWGDGSQECGVLRETSLAHPPWAGARTALHGDMQQGCKGGAEAGTCSDDRPGRQASAQALWEADAKWS